MSEPKPMGPEEYNYDLQYLKQEATEQLKDIVYVCRIHGWSKKDIDGFVQDGWDHYDEVESAPKSRSAEKLGIDYNQD